MIITGFYAYVTFRMLKVNQAAVAAVREQIESSLRPYVTVAVMIEQFPIFHLRIANEGKTSANRMRLRISHDFFSFGQEEENRNIARFNAFNNEIACFPPGAELIFALAQSFVIFADDADPDVTPSRFTVTARYSFGEKTVEETTDVDLTAYLMTAPHPNVQLDQLKKIQETLEKLLNRLPSAG